MKLSLCLQTVFTHQAFVERMREASTLGYSAIEFGDWRTKDLAVITETAAQLNLTMAAMSGIRKQTAYALPLDRLIGIMRNYGRVK